MPMARALMDVVRHRLAREAGEPLAAIPRQSTRSSLAFEEIASMLARGHGAAARARLDDLAIDLSSADPTSVVEHELCSAWAAAAGARMPLAQAHLRAALAVGEREGLVHGFLRAGADVLAEPLTSRERELLAYLPTRLTNVELAQRCYVSVNTIKTHASHIYRKFGVQGRSAAVTRAIELGLLPEPEADARLQRAAP